jgi:hypothetical protein
MTDRSRRFQATESASARPLRRADVIAQRAGRDTLLYDPMADAVHVLNPTAWTIWELCDGKHTPDDMAAHLRVCFAGASDRDVGAGVKLALCTFEHEGLIWRSPEVGGRTAHLRDREVPDGTERPGAT